MLFIDLLLFQPQAWARWTICWRGPLQCTRRCYWEPSKQFWWSELSRRDAYRWNDGYWASQNVGGLHDKRVSEVRRFKACVFPFCFAHYLLLIFSWHFRSKNLKASRSGIPMWPLQYVQIKNFNRNTTNGCTQSAARRLYGHIDNLELYVSPSKGFLPHSNLNDGS